MQGPDAPALQTGQMLSELVSAKLLSPGEGGPDMLAVRTAALDVADRVGVGIAFPPPSADDRGRWSERLNDPAVSRGLSEQVPAVSGAVVRQLAEARESRTRDDGRRGSGR